MANIRSTLYRLFVMDLIKVRSASSVFDVFESLLMRKQVRSTINRKGWFGYNGNMCRVLSCPTNAFNYFLLFWSVPLEMDQ